MREDRYGNILTPPSFFEGANEIISNTPILPENKKWVYPHNSYYTSDPDGGKRFLKTPDNSPAGVIVHYTATYNLKSTINYFKKNVVDVHFVIGHEGEVVQMVDCNRTAAHAGKSKWKEFNGLNNYFIGIEVVSLGWLEKRNKTFYDGYGRVYKGPVVENKTLGYEYWEPFTDKQVDSVIKLCKWLKSEYDIPIENIVGHQECSPGRKNDPGGSLTMNLDELRSKINS